MTADRKNETLSFPKLNLRARDRLISCYPGSVSFLRCFLIVCVVGLTSGQGAEKSIPSVNLPAPPFPIYGDHSGTVTLLVTFDATGKVASCQVHNSSGSAALDKETADFVIGHWHAPALAGKTEEVPIQYKPKSLPFGTPAVPNLLLPGEPSVSFRLWVSFDSEGYVSSFGVFHMSGYEQINERILNWIYAHWRTKEYRHQTTEVNLHFDAPPSGTNPKAYGAPAQ